MLSKYLDLIFYKILYLSRQEKLAKNTRGVCEIFFERIKHLCWESLDILRSMFGLVF